MNAHKSHWRGMRVEGETGGNELSWILSNKELSRFQLLGEHTKVVAVLILTNSQGPRFRLARAKNGQEIDDFTLRLEAYEANQK